MNVELINPDVLTDLCRNHGQFACLCYNTPEERAEAVGKTCMEQGHMSGSRCEYIKFRVTDVDRGTAEQALRHEIGVFVPFEMQDNYAGFCDEPFVTTIPSDQMVKNMASFRYIDKSGFGFETPSVIRNCPQANERYRALMEHINEERRAILDTLIGCGVQPRVANEAANFVLPRATTTGFAIGFTPEAFMLWCNRRLCTRAAEFIREMARQMVAQVSLVNPEFAGKCVPSCEHLLWCPEGKRSCGRYPTRDQLVEKLRIGEKKAR